MSPQEYVRAHGWSQRDKKWVHHRFSGRYTLEDAVEIQKGERLAALAFELGVRVSDVRDVILGRIPAPSDREGEKANAVAVGPTWIPAPTVSAAPAPSLLVEEQLAPPAPKLPPLPTPPDDPPPPARFEAPPAPVPPVVQEPPTPPSDATLPRAIEPYQAPRRPFPPTPPPVVVGRHPPPEPVVEEPPLLATLLKATRRRRRSATIAPSVPPVASSPSAESPVLSSGAVIEKIPEPPPPSLNRRLQPSLGQSPHPRRRTFLKLPPPWCPHRAR